MTGDRWLIAGLGNPGPGYAGNRHNAGFLTADVLAARAGARFKAGKFRALAAEGRLAGRGVTIIKPLTFMNDSGGPVAGVSGYYRFTPGRLVVVHDELDLPFGSVRLKLGGGDNGHNGLRSVTARLGTREYYRARIGIGRPPGRMDPAAYVLRDFSAAERKELPLVLERAADAVEMLLADGLAAAQNAFHATASPDGPGPVTEEPGRRPSGGSRGVPPQASTARAPDRQRAVRPRECPTLVSPCQARGWSRLS